VIVEEKSQADEALAAALPALEMAVQALEELEKKDITEIKAALVPLRRRSRKFSRKFV